MDIYKNFHRMAKSHVATIKDCEILTDEIYKAEYEIEYDKRYQQPTNTNSYEYGNEIAHREASRLANEFIDGLKCESIDYLYNILKGYRQ